MFMVPNSISTLALVLTAAAFAASAEAQSIRRDDIGTQVAQAPSGKQAPAPSVGTPAPSATPAPAAPEKDPRAGDPAHEQAQRLMRAIDAVLQDTAKHRGEARKLPSDKDFLMKPLFTETKEDREKKIRDLLDFSRSASSPTSPWSTCRRRSRACARPSAISTTASSSCARSRSARPRTACCRATSPTPSTASARTSTRSKKKIELNRDEIAKAKSEVADALDKAGIKMEPAQVDLLLDSVLSGDLVRLVAVFNSAKLVDGQLGKLMTASGENVGAARKYFAMHAALFALLVHAQDQLIAKIDTQYLPKLTAIERDVRAARAKTADLLRAENREDQKRALEGNRESQRLAEEAAKGYRRYLMQQREQVAKARQRATHDLQDRRQHLRDGGGELSSCAT